MPSPSSATRQPHACPPRRGSSRDRHRRARRGRISSRCRSRLWSICDSCARSPTTGGHVRRRCQRRRRRARGARDRLQFGARPRRPVRRESTGWSGRRYFSASIRRQRHQVLDQPLHPPRLVEHDLEEARRGSPGRRPLRRRASRYSRGSRRAACAVRGWHWRRNRRASARRRNCRCGRRDGRCAARRRSPPARISQRWSRAPSPTSSTGRSACRAETPSAVGGGGMADRDARILADDMLAEQRARGEVGTDDAARSQQQQWFRHRVQHRTDGGAGDQVRRRGRRCHRNLAVAADRDQHRRDPADQCRRRAAQRVGDDVDGDGGRACDDDRPGQAGI